MIAYLSLKQNATSRSHHPIEALAKRASDLNTDEEDDKNISNTSNNTSNRDINNSTTTKSNTNNTTTTSTDRNTRYEEARTNARRCLALYLNHKPKSTPTFLTALQSLPVWLRDQAVEHPAVQELLNDNVS